MCLILKFNKYFLIPLIIEWVDVSFGRLVLALGNKRHIFLEILESHMSRYCRSLFPPSKPVALTVPMLKGFQTMKFEFPENIVVDWNTLKEYKSGFVQFFKGIANGSHGSLTANRKLLLRCLSNVKCISIADYGSEKFLRHCKKAEIIIIADHVGISNNILPPVCSPLIRVLDLLGYSVEEGPLKDICRRCPNLIVLRLPRILYPRSIFDTVIVHCRKLETLSCNRFRTMHDTVPVEHYFQRLVLMSNALFTVIPSSGLVFRIIIWYRHEKLQSLSLPFADEEGNGLPGHFRWEDALACSSLTHLNLFSGLDNSWLERIFHRNNGIQSLRLSLNPLSDIIPALGVVASKLLSLSIDTIMNEANCNLPELVSLVKLSVRHTNSLFLGPWLQKCQQLRTLNLERTLICDSLGYELHSIPLLTKLNASCCKLITEQFLIMLGLHCVHINELQLKSCTFILDIGLCRVVKNRKLTCLDIQRCRNISTYSLEFIRTYCQDLKRFTFIDTLISPDEAEAALGHLPFIELIGVGSGLSNPEKDPMAELQQSLDFAESATLCAARKPQKISLEL